MKKTSQDLIITLFGAVTSLITAIILSWVEQTMDLAFYSVTYWVIIPVGAIGSGFVAASGYYLGAILFNHKPTKLILLNMVGVSIGTYFLIQYLSYFYMEIDGEQISNMITFYQYLDLQASNSAIQFTRSSSGSAIELGSWGYLYAFIQIIGFSIGGFSLYGYLSSRIFCEKCSRYYSNKDRSERYSGDGDMISDTVCKIASLTGEDKFSEAILAHAECGDVKFNTKNHHLKLKLLVKLCKSCATNCLCIEVEKINSKNNWDRIDDLSFNVLTPHQLSLE